MRVMKAEYRQGALPDHNKLHAVVSTVRNNFSQQHTPDLTTLPPPFRYFLFSWTSGPWLCLSSDVDMTFGGDTPT